VCSDRWVWQRVLGQGREWEGDAMRCDAIHTAACYDILRIGEGAVASRLSNRMKLNERRIMIKYLPVWFC
jgi:hypothetical protein